MLEDLGIEQIFSSPYLRCVQTIGPFAEASRLSIELRDDLREVDIVKSLREDFSDIWKHVWGDFRFALPECEPLGQAQNRFLAVIDSILLDSPHETIAICAHGAVIGLLLHTIVPGEGSEHADSLTNPDVIRINVRGDEWIWDRRFHLAGLDPIVSHHSETPIKWE